MPISAEIEAAEQLLGTLAGLKSQGVQKAIQRASKRAATAARTAGTKSIRSIYTMKSGNLKARTQIRKEEAQRNQYPVIKLLKGNMAFL